ncbi:hypothetical protein [Nocardia goodfellowii]|uniref:Uncharacterized protein n=1 Tax=Nocardia goodfellowii TaxID=882446 RepID=A0ABS4QN65_9NOCA|nr:hypothetical protein [Nocardia goodfellowii]MBP2193147.1 hypothetical protein [Nocardia goodfellowii]
MPRSLFGTLFRAVGRIIAGAPVLALFVVVAMLVALFGAVLLLTNSDPTDSTPTSPTVTTTRNCAPFACTVG